MNNHMKIYYACQMLPDSDSKVLCYGHKTYCCECDMEKEKKWHFATFEMHISSYKLKAGVPPIDESQIEYAEVRELWHTGNDEHVIGVTKWRYLPKPMTKEELAHVVEQLDNLLVISPELEEFMEQCEELKI
jgi:hypothetical protein